MLPMFPTTNFGSLMNNGTSTGTTNEEQEISALEQEQQNYLNLVETIAQDLTPIGKIQSETAMDGSAASDDSAGSDDQESSASEAEDPESDDNEIELT